MEPSPVYAALAAERRFVGYTADKCPWNPHAEAAARVNDPRTWSTYAEARTWAERTGGHVGFLPLTEYLVIDFDGAVEHGTSSIPG